MLTVLVLVGLVMVLGLVGWDHGEPLRQKLLWATRAVVGCYGALFIWHRWLIRIDQPFRWRRDGWLVGFAVLLVGSAVFENWLGGWIGEAWHIPVRGVLIGLAFFQQFLAILLRIPVWIPFLEQRIIRRFRPGMVLVVTFVLLVLHGTALLKLPNATTEPLTWLQALFTATSAVCVTGLIVVDTGTAFTGLGQLILLVLMQMGAFGIITLTFFLAMLTGQGFSVASRVFLREALSAENLKNLSLTVASIIGLTFIFEGIGALMIAFFWGDLGGSGLERAWYAIFHSVSAFCNAGFSLFSDGLMNEQAVVNYGVQSTIVVLILLGGIGFPVILEFLRRCGAGVGMPGAAAHRGFSLHFRLVVGTTAILLLLGTTGLLLGELISGEPWAGGRLLWEAFFNSVTARTAGFNITDVGAISGAGVFLLILLMFIGGSPGGVAGGVKTTTFAMALLNMRRILLNREDVQLMGRRIESEIPSRAFAVLLLSQAWIAMATLSILLLQPEFDFLEVLFEVVSAFATVGLSRGITADLEAGSQMILVLTMLIGRIGILNVCFAMLTPYLKSSRLRLPRERVIID